MPQSGDGDLWPTTDDDSLSEQVEGASTHELPVPGKPVPAGWVDPPKSNGRDEPHAKPAQQRTQPVSWPVADLERLAKNQDTGATSFLRPITARAAEGREPTGAAPGDQPPAQDQPTTRLTTDKAPRPAQQDDDAKADRDTPAASPTWPDQTEPDQPPTRAGSTGTDDNLFQPAPQENGTANRTWPAEQPHTPSAGDATVNLPRPDKDGPGDPATEGAAASTAEPETASSPGADTPTAGDPAAETRASVAGPGERVATPSAGSRELAAASSGEAGASVAGSGEQVATSSAGASADGSAGQTAAASAGTGASVAGSGDPVATPSAESHEQATTSSAETGGPVPGGATGGANEQAAPSTAAATPAPVGATPRKDEQPTDPSPTSGTDKPEDRTGSGDSGSEAAADPSRVEGDDSARENATASPDDRSQAPADTVNLALPGHDESASKQAADAPRPPAGVDQPSQRHPSDDSPAGAGRSDQASSGGADSTAHPRERESADPTRTAATDQPDPSDPRDSIGQRAPSTDAPIGPNRASDSADAAAANLTPAGGQEQVGRLPAGDGEQESLVDAPAGSGRAGDSADAAAANLTPAGGQEQAGRLPAGDGEQESPVDAPAGGRAGQSADATAVNLTWPGQQDPADRSAAGTGRAEQAAASGPPDSADGDRPDQRESSADAPAGPGRAGQSAEATAVNLTRPPSRPPAGTGRSDQGSGRPADRAEGDRPGQRESSADAPAGAGQSAEATAVNLTRPTPQGPASRPPSSTGRADQAAPSGRPDSAEGNRPDQRESSADTSAGSGRAGQSAEATAVNLTRPPSRPPTSTGRPDQRPAGPARPGQREPGPNNRPGQPTDSAPVNLTRDTANRPPADRGRPGQQPADATVVNLPRPGGNTDSPTVFIRPTHPTKDGQPFSFVRSRHDTYQPPDNTTADRTERKAEWPPPEPPRAAPERVGPQPEEPPAPRRRNPLLVAAIAIVAVLGLAAGVVFGVPGLSDKLGLTGDDAIAVEPPPAPISYTPGLRGPDSNAPAPTPEGVTSVLAGPMSSPALGSVTGVVIDPATNQTLYERDSGNAITPASTGKILTAAAALLSLDHTAQLVTKVVQGEQPGEVIIVGGGDPTISSLEPGAESIYPGAAHLSELVDQVRASGAPVQTVYIDQSRYSSQRMAPSWLPADIGAGYIAPIVPAMLDGDRRDPTVNYSPRTTDPGRTLVDEFAARTGASAASSIEKKAPANAKVLGEIRSAPMSQLVDNMLDSSENTLGDIIAHEVAIQNGQEPSFDGASKATLDVLRQNGFDVDGVVLKDGSGMSEQNKVSARLLAQILAVAAGPDGKDPRTAKLRPLLGGLPVAGGSGTLAGRYGEGAATEGRGWVRAKTGTLTGVNSLAGIVLDKDNRLLVFAFLTSGTSGNTARPALDTVASALRGCGCRW